MLHKFRHLYPQGSLLSELVNLDQGLFVVKVTVKNQDVVWGSGLAAAETVEQAEDQARIRALMTLFATENEPATPPAKPHSNQLDPTLQFQEVKPLPNNQPSAIENNIPASFSPPSFTTDSLASDPSQQSGHSVNPEQVSSGSVNPGQVNPGSINSGRATPTNNNSPELTNPALVNPQITPTNGQEASNNYPTPQNSLNDPAFAPETTNSTTLSPSSNPVEPAKQTPINIFDQPLDSPSTTAPNISTPNPMATNVATPMESTENVIEFDFNEIKFKIDLEMKRLGWTSEQGRDYLLSTYGKRSRLHLKNEEILEFWRYLEALP